MFNLLKKHIKLILLWGFVFAVLSGGVSLFMPMQYSANSQVLIISKNQTGIDPYTQAKSAETIGANLISDHENDRFLRQSNAVADGFLR